MASIAQEESRSMSQNVTWGRQNDGSFYYQLKNQPMVVDRWDESLWSLMVEKAVVGKDGSIKFIFYNEIEITEMLFSHKKSF
jgi:hypothetical protein